MSSDLAISISSLCKAYRIFDKPSSRLWNMLLRGRGRFYREHVALEKVSFDVARGETVGVVGRNGSGKSTLLSIICGTLPATSGKVVVNGRVAALLELGAGFNPELTGRENIDLCAQIYGLGPEQVEQRRDAIIEFADIGDYIDQPVKTYSSGMFTRLAFGVIANVDADILVIDEALAVGDAYFVQKCMRHLRSFRDQGGTLFFVSHDMGSITALCDRAIWLRGGMVVMDAGPKQVAQAYLADLYRQQQADVVSHEMPASDKILQVGGGELGDEVDPRQDLLIHSNIRNDISVRAFVPAHDFGAGGAEILDSTLSDDRGRPISWVVGGEVVKLVVRVHAKQPMAEAIVGFVLKDKNGQPLFGDNSYLSFIDAPLSLAMGEVARFMFEFRMPILPVGTYSVSLAVSDGTQKDHVVQQWIHDAIMLSSHASSVATGLIGIPMRNIAVDMES